MTRIHRRDFLKTCCVAAVAGCSKRRPISVSERQTTRQGRASDRSATNRLTSFGTDFAPSTANRAPPSEISENSHGRTSAPGAVCSQAL